MEYREMVGTVAVSIALVTAVALTLFIFNL